MATRTVTIGSSSGLHQRPAKLFTDAAKRQPVKVRIGIPGKKPVPADSILAVMTLGAHHGIEATLEAEGPEADTVLDELAAMLAKDLDAEPENA